MTYYDVVIQPDGRAALVLRIEPPRYEREDRHESEYDRGVVIIDPSDDTRRGVVILQM
jgi:hypothetical protein